MVPPLFLSTIHPGTAFVLSMHPRVQLWLPPQPHARTCTHAGDTPHACSDLRDIVFQQLSVVQASSTKGVSCESTDTTVGGTSQMIYHRGGEPERAMHCLFNVMPHGTQAMDNSRICHRLLFHERGIVTLISMSVVSNTSCSHFFGQ